VAFGFGTIARFSLAPVFDDTFADFVASGLFSADSSVTVVNGTGSAGGLELASESIAAVESVRAVAFLEGTRLNDTISTSKVSVKSTRVGGVSSSGRVGLSGKESLSSSSNGCGVFPQVCGDHWRAVGTAAEIDNSNDFEVVNRSSDVLCSDDWSTGIENASVGQKSRGWAFDESRNAKVLSEADFA